MNYHLVNKCVYTDGGLVPSATMVGKDKSRHSRPTSDKKDAPSESGGGGAAMSRDSSRDAISRDVSRDTTSRDISRDATTRDLSRDTASRDYDRSSGGGGEKEIDRRNRSQMERLVC